MSAGKECENAKVTLKEFAGAVNKDPGTIRNWYLHNRPLFDFALAGFVMKKYPLVKLNSAISNLIN